MHHSVFSNIDIKDKHINLHIAFQQIEKSQIFVPGENHVVVSTWGSTGYNLDNFQLKTLLPTHGIFSILCEKGEAILLESCYFPFYFISLPMWDKNSV